MLNLPTVIKANLVYRVPGMWLITELELFLWRELQAARSCVVLFVLRYGLLTLTQTGLKLCSPTTASQVLGLEVYATMCCQKYTLVSGIQNWRVTDLQVLENWS